MGRGDVKSVAFDFSGVYLALGGGGDQGNAVHVKVVKDWSSSVVRHQILIAFRESFVLFNYLFFHDD